MTTQEKTHAQADTVSAEAQETGAVLHLPEATETTWGLLCLLPGEPQLADAAGSRGVSGARLTGKQTREAAAGALRLYERAYTATSPARQRVLLMRLDAALKGLEPKERATYQETLAQWRKEDRPCTR